MNKQRYVAATIEQLHKANILLTPKEKELIEIADFNLSNYPETGLQLLTYINIPEYCAKELVLFPNQTCPEHRHPPIKTNPGKKETFRCRHGKVILFVDDENLTLNDKGMYSPPIEDKQWFTCNRFIVLNPGEQYTIEPNTLHWFQAGNEGAIVSEFSTQSTDEFDIFTDPRIIR